MPETVTIIKSLKSRGAPLASTTEQRRRLESPPGVAPFHERLAREGLAPLTATGIDVLQINVGKLCNQTCRHCHVDAGPDRSEVMSREVARQCMAVLGRTSIPTVDLTGGAPELNPSFRWMVEEARRLERHVIDRCNLSVLLLPSQSDLAAFLAEHRVEVIASLPSFAPRPTDAQRGAGVFHRSVEALRRLNELGYGREGSGLVLNLITNPVGAFLPPSQAEAEERFSAKLSAQHGVSFNRLYTITNMPISRFLEFLLERGSYEEYMERLADAFNSAAAAGVMCRTMISVGWDGTLYDCDFNQMLDLEVAGAPAKIGDFDPELLSRRFVVTGNHCYGCTAGAGSSCGGATA